MLKFNYIINCIRTHNRTNIDTCTFINTDTDTDTDINLGINSDNDTVIDTV